MHLALTIGHAFEAAPQSITRSTMNAEISRLVDAISAADAVMVGAGSGLSAAAGFTYSGKRFQAYFADFIETYGFSDMYSAGF